MMPALIRSVHGAAGIACAVVVVAVSAACGGGGASSTSSEVPHTQPTLPVSTMEQLQNTRLQAVIDVGGAPDAPDWQAQGFGAVWVANSDINAVQRIDPTTNRVTVAVPIGARLVTAWPPALARCGRLTAGERWSGSTRLRVGSWRASPSTSSPTRV